MFQDQKHLCGSCLKGGCREEKGEPTGRSHVVSWARYSPPARAGVWERRTDSSCSVRSPSILSGHLMKPHVGLAKSISQNCKHASQRGKEAAQMFLIPSHLRDRFLLCGDSRPLPGSLPAGPRRGGG